MLEVRLAAVHPWFVHTNFELAGPGDGRVAAPAVVLVDGVEVAVIALSSFGSFHQRVDYDN